MRHPHVPAVNQITEVQEAQEEAEIPVEIVETSGLSRATIMATTENAIVDHKAETTRSSVESQTGTRKADRAETGATTGATITTEEIKVIS